MICTGRDWEIVDFGKEIVQQIIFSTHLAENGFQMKSIKNSQNIDFKEYWG